MAVGHIVGRLLKKQEQRAPIQEAAKGQAPWWAYWWFITTHVKCDTGKMQQVAKGTTVPEATGF